MTAITRLVVPTDFSPPSDIAVTYAFDLAARLGARIHLLHVIEEWALTGTYLNALAIELPGLRERVIDEAGKRLAAVATARAARQVPTTTEVREGSPWEVIADVARQGEADLIVMGSHGRSGLPHALLGSVAERVLRTAPCPVLTIRESTSRRTTTPVVTGEPPTPT